MRIPHYNTKKAPDVTLQGVVYECVRLTAQVGASFGGLSGRILDGLLPGFNIQPGLYSLCAATAMLGGVFRSSISLVRLSMVPQKTVSRPTACFECLTACTAMHSSGCKAGGWC